eukprot:774327-Alexandrium_andersonii.AAC.1
MMSDLEVDAFLGFRAMMATRLPPARAMSSTPSSARSSSRRVSPTPRPTPPPSPPSTTTVSPRWPRHRGRQMWTRLCQARETKRSRAS